MHPSATALGNRLSCHSEGALVELRDSQYEPRSLQQRPEESTIIHRDF